MTRISLKRQSVVRKKVRNLGQTFILTRLQKQQQQQQQQQRRVLAASKRAMAFGEDK